MRSTKNKMVILIIFLFVVIGSITIMIKSTFSKDIEEVLKTKSYSYLPKTAQNYVKEMYEQTGEIILTEKNKEKDKPYLNPKYVEYLELSLEEKEKVSLIPNVVVMEYSSKQVASTNFPSTYNLNSVGGKTFVTPMNNQGTLGLCWGFAALQQAESYLMVSKNESYSNLTEKFSVRQIDYAISTNGIKNYLNEYGARLLTDGSNYYQASLIMSYGLSMVDDEFMPYNSDKTLRNLSDILNFKNSKYELNSSIMMPILASDATTSTRNSYISSVKDYVMKYGGAYVGTGSPDGNCGFKNTDGTYAMVDADDCVGNSGHAMQIIGWDDNYKYSYCRSGSSHLDVNANGSCDEGTLVSDKGAWILKNSWGEESEYKYVYMGYSSYGMEINFSTSLTEMSDRNWDNVYNKGIIDFTFNISTDDTVTFNQKINTNEKIEKIKFISYGKDGEYTISIETATKKYTDIKTIKTNEPGIYTVDLSSLNILLEDMEFKITIKSANDKHFIPNSISVYTTNEDKTPIIQTKDLGVNSVTIDEGSNYRYLLYSDTKNIESDTRVSYSLWKDGQDYTSYLDSDRTYLVAANNIGYALILRSNIPSGEYILKTKFDDYEFESKVTVPRVRELKGSGTEDDPYLIYDGSDLEQMRFKLDAYYLLKNDIELAKEWVPIGTKDRPFRGGLDGGGHTIYDLVIDEDNDDTVGFFGYVEPKFDYAVTLPFYERYEEDSYIKNITFENAKVSNKGNAGILIGQLTFYGDNPKYRPEKNSYSYGNPRIFIDNVHFIGGSVTSSEKDAGVVVANVDIIPDSSGYPRLKIDNMFTSTSISGYHSAGLIGYINDSYQSGTFIMLDLDITNFQNVGVLKQSIFDLDYEDGPNYYSPVIGGLYGNIGATLNNFIINSIFDDVDYNKQFMEKNDLFFIGYYDPATSKNLSYSLYTENGYYATNYENKNSFNSKFFISTDQLKDDTLFDSWDEFDTYWKIETIDGIKRIPVLKNIVYDYTSISDINIKLYDRVNLSNYIDGPSSLQYISYSIISNDKVVDIKENIDDYTIEALSKGTAKIHIVNQYDGFEKDISINVTADKVDEPTITFISNLNNTNSYTQTLTALSPFTLMKNKFDVPGYKFTNWNTMADGSGISYDDEEYFESGIDENLRLYAQWEKEFTHEIDKYSVDETNKYIDLIEVNTTVEDFKTNITLGEGYTVNVDSKEINGKKVMYTGGKTKIYYGDTLYMEYTNIVRGDANGDGVMDIFDYIRIMKDIMEETFLSGIYKIGADVTKDNMVDIFDYIRIMKKIME